MATPLMEAYKKNTQKNEWNLNENDYILIILEVLMVLCIKKLIIDLRRSRINVHIGTIEWWTQ